MTTVDPTSVPRGWSVRCKCAWDDPLAHLSVREAAVLVGCPAHTLRAAARRGAIDGAYKDPDGRWWFRLAGVRRWSEFRRTSNVRRPERVRNPYWKGRIVTDAGVHRDAITDARYPS